MFEILKYSFGNIFWGVLVALLCMVLFASIIKGWYKDATFSPISYIVGVILFFFLSIQCILLIGSIQILDMADIYEKEISNLINSVYNATDEVSMVSADDIIKDVIDRFPILGYYISGGEFSGFTANELPHAITDELRSFMHGYIFRRILWCLGFVIVGAICVIKSMSKQKQNVTSNISRPIRYDNF